MYILLIYPHGSSFPSIPIYSHPFPSIPIIPLIAIFIPPHVMEPAPFAKVSSRTPLRRSANVKWGRLWLFKDILMSLGRQSGAELGRC